MPLLVQLGVSALLVVIVTVIHGTGIVVMSRWFDCEERALERQKLAVREFTVMVPMALTLFVLHALEIAVFAVFYMLAGDVHNFADALHVSGLAYSTLGILEGMVDEWPIVVALEGLAGFLMIGWSAAVFVTDMEQVLRRR